MFAEFRGKSDGEQGFGDTATYGLLLLHRVRADIFANVSPTSTPSKTTSRTERGSMSSSSRGNINSQTSPEVSEVKLV